MDNIEGLVYTLIFLSIYFLPAIIANHRDHHNSTAIWMLNLFFGWTLVGWVIALVWALSNPPPKA